MDDSTGAARGRRAAVLIAAVVAIMAAVSGCSWVKGVFGNDDPNAGSSVSVFDVKVGDCFTAPTEPRAELSELTKVPCTAPHEQEAYAILTYLPPAGTDPSVFPGNQALDTFAKGSCASAFAGYVGTAYPDSSLFYTYLLPSARSWTNAEDRSVTCFVTTTGATLTKSVKGSKM